MALPISTASLFNTSPTGIDRDALVRLLNQLINPETAASAFTNVDNHFSTPQTLPAATTPNQAVNLGQLLSTFGRNSAATYSASTTLTPANAGQLVFYTGSASGTFTLPLSNAAGPYLIPIIISNQSVFELTIAPATGDNLDLSVSVLQPGQACALNNDGGIAWHHYYTEAGNTSPVVVGAATANNQAVTLGQLPVTTPAASAAVTVGASPFAYTAPSAGSVCVSGGAITSVTLARGGVTVYTSGLAADQVVVRTGDVVTVTYTTAPTMYFLGN